MELGKLASVDHGDNCLWDSESQPAPALLAAAVTTFHPRYKAVLLGPVWEHTPPMSALRRLDQEGQDFQANLGYREQIPVHCHAVTFLSSIRWLSRKRHCHSW